MTTSDIELMESVKAFLKYEDESILYDELSTNGDGYVETWKSFRLEAILSKIRLAVNNKEKELTK